MKRIACAVCFLMAFGSVGRILPALAGDLVISTKHGRINWSEHFVEANGSGVPSADSLNTPLARDQAIRNARRQAYQNLLNTVLTLPLTSESTIRDYVTNKDEVLSKIEGLLSNAPMETTRYLSDGTVEVVKRMTLSGAFLQLVLPETIIQLEMKKMGKGASEESGRAYTGLVVDARGLTLTPALCFKIFDEAGQEVYGPAYVSRENAVQHGICTYRTEIVDIAASERIGGNPLIIRGLKTVEAGGTDIVISSTDALLLRSAVEHLFFLRKCGVLVLVDPVATEKAEKAKES